ncbi:MAG: protein translocase subunit SecF [Zoogloeaceae bacterium]|jgi:preprotein translocase subunit SecF|nr:protein translocase subunit SecF [Zoogloeaceae bacterium]
MEFFRIKKDIPFMRHALVFNLISLLTFVLAVFFLATRGLHFSVEFTGGTQIQVIYPQGDGEREHIRAALEADGFTDLTVQNYGSSKEFLIRIPTRPGVDVGQESERVMAALAKGAPGAEKQGASNVGAQVGQELAESGLTALLLVIVGIMVYLAFRFEWRYAVATIVANLHDVVIILGFFAFFQWEFSLSVLAAVLAILGYSVNESVVVFDRVRETFRKSRNLTVPLVLDHAITSTISRTVITHGSTQVMVLSMLIFGGEALHYFSVALTIGICFGIYSSVLVASPVAMWLGISREQFVKLAKPKDPNVNADGACV